jgi:hypothetical protein
LNDAVAGLTPKCVVDQLETVDIRVNDRQWTRLLTAHPVSNRFVIRAVEKAGQLIVIVQILNLKELTLGIRDIDNNPFKRLSSAGLVKQSLVDIENPFPFS